MEDSGYDYDGIYHGLPYKLGIHQRSDTNEWTSNGPTITLGEEKGHRLYQMKPDGICFASEEDAIAHWKDLVSTKIDQDFG